MENIIRSNYIPYVILWFRNLNFYIMPFLSVDFLSIAFFLLHYFIPHKILRQLVSHSQTTYFGSNPSNSKSHIQLALL